MSSQMHFRRRAVASLIFLLGMLASFSVVAGDFNYVVVNNTGQGSYTTYQLGLVAPGVVFRSEPPKSMRPGGYYQFAFRAPHVPVGTEYFYVSFFLAGDPPRRELCFTQVEYTSKKLFVWVHHKTLRKIHPKYYCTTQRINKTTILVILGRY